LSSFVYQPLSRGIEGFRFTLFGVLVFVLAYLSNITVDQRKKFLNVYLSLAVIISVWAIIEMLLPGKYWGEWGIIQKDLVWGYGWHTVGSMNQLASFLGGPNQLASYLLPAFFIVLLGAIEAFTNNQKKQSYYNLVAIILFVFVTLLTFSRSAAIGLFFGLLLIPFIKGHNVLLKRGVIFLAIALSVLGLLLYDQNNPILTHGQSQSGHIEALNQSLAEIGYRFNHQPIKIIIGDGLGSAGPLAVKYQDGLVSESWYLQLFLEIGLIGVITWLSIVVLIIKKLVEKKQLALSVGLVAISITALFLHTWADNPAMTYSVFILLGVNLRKDK